MAEIGVIVRAGGRFVFYSVQVSSDASRAEIVEAVKQRLQGDGFIYDNVSEDDIFEQPD